MEGDRAYERDTRGSRGPANQALTEEQHSALAAALGMDPSEINPTNALAALYEADARAASLDAKQEAVDILIDAGIVRVANHA
jgi:phosphomannomutase